MQYEFSLTSEAVSSIENCLSGDRINTYLRETGNDLPSAIRLYLCNMKLSALFHAPICLFEVALRNKIAAALKRTYTKNSRPWYEDGRLLCMLNIRLKKDLQSSVQKSKLNRDHIKVEGGIIAEQSLAFWQSFFRKIPTEYLWPNGFEEDFQNIPREVSRTDIYEKIDRIRNFRNRVSHHEPIWNKKPTSICREILEISSWINCDLRWLIDLGCRDISRMINQKPTLG